MVGATVKENMSRVTLRVRSSEVDQQGIVFNSRYLEYVDVGLTEFLRQRGIDLLDTARRGHFDIVLARATLDYRSPASLDQLLDLHTWLVRMGTKSFTVGCEFYPSKVAEPLLVQAEMVYVSYDATSRTTKPIPDDIRELLQGERKEER
jgi:acyl-CoA thioester hydrolase